MTAMNSMDLKDELRYKLLKALEDNPSLSQRELASLMGVSLGKTNYCVKALMDAGFIKMSNFAKSTNKTRYAYCLTPKGIKEKADVTLRFLNAKEKQYELIQAEITRLKNELGQS